MLGGEGFPCIPLRLFSFSLVLFFAFPIVDPGQTSSAVFTLLFLSLTPCALLPSVFFFYPLFEFFGILNFLYTPAALQVRFMCFSSRATCFLTNLVFFFCSDNPRAHSSSFLPQDAVAASFSFPLFSLFPSSLPQRNICSASIKVFPIVVALQIFSTRAGLKKSLLLFYIPFSFLLFC